LSASMFSSTPTLPAAASPIDVMTTQKLARSSRPARSR
jgi:hypothetical protein